jgi:hypothetical protein
MGMSEWSGIDKLNLAHEVKALYNSLSRVDRV